MIAIKGPLKIISSNIVLCLSLILIKHLSSNTATGLVVFSISFALATTLMKGLSSAIRLPRTTKTTNRSYLHLFGWSCAVTFIYFLFVYFKDSLQLSHIIIAKSMTPLIAVFLSGDFKDEKNDLTQMILIVVPIIFLFLIAYLQWASSEQISLENWGIFCILILAYSISQTLARVVVKSFKPSQAVIGSTFLNSILYFLLACSLFNIEEITWSPQMLWGIPLMGVCIITASFLALSGLRETKPYLSSLCLSSSVPISLVMQNQLQSVDVKPASILLSIIYLLFLHIQTKRKSLQVNSNITKYDKYNKKRNPPKATI